MRRGGRSPFRDRPIASGVIAAAAITAFVLLAPVAMAQGVGCSTGSATFTSTGAEQCYLVPALATALRVVAVGAPGAGGTTGGAGGAGARVEATVPVGGSQFLYVNVGGQGQGPVGGFNGGGDSGTGGGGGGGASDLRSCSSAVPNCPAGPGLLLIAGGGGGGGADSIAAGGDGGAAGVIAADGGAGSDAAPDAGGGGGGDGATVVAGGAAGSAGAGTNPPGDPGEPGVALDGGDGGGPAGKQGGGGGGGYFGGGGGGGGGRNGGGQGGGGGGGGAGSSFVAAAASAVTIGTDATGTPMIQIVPEFSALATTSPASGLSATAATLNAIVNPLGSATSARFEYVSDARFAPAAADPYAAGGGTPSQAVGGDGANHLVQAQVSGLDPATIYHFRVVATGNATVNGGDQTFTTLAAPPDLADLAVDASGRPRGRRRGGRLSYRLRVVDAGPATARGVTALIDLPRGAIKVRAPEACADDTPRLVTCDLGDLEPGRLVPLRLRLRTRHRGAAKLRLRVLSQTLDANPLNDTATVKTRIRRR